MLRKAKPARGAPRARTTTHQAAVATLRTLDGRLTGSRLDVLKLLMASDRAMSPKEVADALKDHSAIDRVTVYRNLEWLSQQGIAHKVVGDDQQAHFMLSRPESGKVHPHFVCRRCAGMFCLESASVSTPELPRGFVSESQELMVYGHCAQCAASAANAANVANATKKS